MMRIVVALCAVSAVVSFGWSSVAVAEGAGCFITCEADCDESNPEGPGRDLCYEDCATECAGQGPDEGTPDPCDSEDVMECQEECAGSSDPNCEADCYIQLGCE